MCRGSAITGAVSGAGYATVDTAVDGNGHCKNGNPAVNCNQYDGKEFVWLNGGPAANGLGPDGQYFFAVLAPVANRTRTTAARRTCPTTSTPTRTAGSRSAAER